MSIKIDRTNKKRNLFILIAMLAVLAIVGGIASLSSPQPRPAQASQQVSAPVATQVAITDVEVQEAVRSSKQEMYCYRLFANLKESMQTRKIENCLDQTHEWTTEDFDTNMPADPTN